MSLHKLTLCELQRKFTAGEVSAKEIARAYGYARELGFPQINIDLIAGMVEETEENWR